MELITSIIIIVFAILQIVLFFKIWEMTNDVKYLRDNLILPKRNIGNWSKDFALKITLNQKEQAKEILYKEILSSNAFTELINASSATDTYKLSLIEKINNEYAIYLKAIGESSITIDCNNEIYNVFK